MQQPRLATLISSILLASSLAACGGGGSGNTSSSAATQSGLMSLSVSDDSNQDWATIGVKIQRIDFVTQNGRSITVYAPTTPTEINLAQLDQLSELLGTVSVPVGSYTGAVLTLAANPGDVTLIAAADPEAGFAATAGSTIPSDQIQIQHARGAIGQRTTQVNVDFTAPVTVTTGSNAPLDIEFNLDHPAFIVGHVPITSAGNVVWAVNFKGPVRHHVIRDLRRLVLRHSYGLVNSVSSDNTTLNFDKVVAVRPLTDPEQGRDTNIALSVLADATNGTLFYNVDAPAAPQTLRDFSTLSSNIIGKYVRVAARYQPDGTLVATRIWASSSFDAIWKNPEGHVLHVDATNHTLDVSNENGGVTQLLVNDNTQFYFHQSLGNSTPIGTGTGFLSNALVRGFKVQVTVVDPLARPLVAATVDIQTAAFDGKISNANNSTFDYTRNFVRNSDDYHVTLPYISAQSLNGVDANGNAILGYKWWNFAYPTLVTTGIQAIPDFVAATSGAVNFGGSYGAVTATGISTARWGDSANTTGWAADRTILLPTPLPLGHVATGFASNAFTMTVPTGANTVTIDMGVVPGAATLVYQIDRTGPIVSVNPIDITTSDGLATVTQNLTTGVPVKVFGVPQANGNFKAYVVSYYTGTVMSTQ